MTDSCVRRTLCFSPNWSSTSRSPTTRVNQSKLKGTRRSSDNSEHERFISGLSLRDALAGTDRATTGKPHLGDRTPSCFLNLRTLNIFLGNGSHLRFQIVAYEMKFVDAILIGWRNAASPGGRAKISQPSPASTDLNPRTSRKNARSASLRADDERLGSYAEPEA
jgi:hypothetical protein